jgi:hypothetical protein
MDRQEFVGAGADRFRSDVRKRAGEMLSNAGGKIDGEHLSGPLGRKTSLVGCSKWINMM